MATLFGLLAIVLWSTLVGLFREVSEMLGPTGGAAMVYSSASVLLLIVVGPPRLGSFSRPYLIVGSVLFVAYEMCLSLSIGYAKSGRQAIDVSVVNYLWPSLTILFEVIFNRRRVNLFIIPGLMLCLVGVCWVLGGGKGIVLTGLVGSIKTNPQSYVLAFAGAVIWSVYCILTSRETGGKNGITLFFALSALALWAVHLIAGGATMTLSLRTVMYVVLTGAALGFGYAAWNFGIVRGDVAILATVSYFAPILSSILAALFLNTPLSVSFWQGASMVSVGSLLCWHATRSRKSNNRGDRT
jgi:drug/metabolite transporter (DMT)-like permease